MSNIASTSDGHLSSYMKDEVGLDDEPDKNGTESVVVTENALAVSVPRWLSLKNRKLVLHVDLNNTILVSDAVTGHGTVAALEYFLSSVTWGRVTKRGQWEWTSNAPSLLPPQEGTVSYYSQFGRVAGFTGSPDGRRFRGVLEEHLELLRWPEGQGAEPELAVTGEDGRLYHWILPSFFQLLRDLVEEGRDFAVLFRTFGSDLPRVLTAMSRALTQGRHPLFPDLPDLQLGVNVTPGQIRCSRKEVLLTRSVERLSSRGEEGGRKGEEGGRKGEAGGERALYRYLSSVQGLGGFQDHFDWWSRNTYSMQGGKPLWVDPFDRDVQHIFIDDNIRQNDQDTIVHPRVFVDPGGSETRTACTSELYDLCLIQTDLLRAISDPGYFTKRIHVCLENYDRNLQQGSD